MKDVDVFEDYAGNSRDIIKLFDNLDPINKAATLAKMSQLQQAEKRQEQTNEALEKLPEFFSVKEVARKLHVSEQTIRNWIKSGEIKYHRFGGSIRISSQDILGFCQGFDGDLAACLEDNIYVDKETHEVVPFEKDKIYRIINENKMWVTLFSEKWEKSARFSKLRFGKFFSIAEDWQISKIKFNFDELG
jgi:excisionase family DNA binding protein